YQFTGKLTYLLNENHNVALAVYGNPNTTSGLSPAANGAYPINGGEGAILTDLSQGSTDVSLRYSGKLLNKSMLVEATAAYHHEINNTNVVGLNGLSAAQVHDTPSISWRQQNSILDPRIATDPLAPAYQNSAAVQAA